MRLRRGWSPRAVLDWRCWEGGGRTSPRGTHGRSMKSGSGSQGLADRRVVAGQGDCDGGDRSRQTLRLVGELGERVLKKRNATWDHIGQLPSPSMASEIIVDANKRGEES